MIGLPLEATKSITSLLEILCIRVAFEFNLTSGLFSSGH